MSRRAGLTLALGAAVLVMGLGAAWVAFGRGHSSAESHGTLSAHEYSLALTEAKKIQANVKGTFIGATAFAGGRVRPFNVGHDCPDVRLVHVRVVWKRDANFAHLDSPGGAPHDGPRRALLMTLDPKTGDECAGTARYSHVAAAPFETLLYGQWPGRAGER
jgi:hypothetical protein